MKLVEPSLLASVLTALVSAWALPQCHDNAVAAGESSEECLEEPLVSLLQVERALHLYRRTGRESASNVLYPFGGFGVMWGDGERGAREEIKHPPFAVFSPLIEGSEKRGTLVNLNSTTFGQLSSVTTKPILSAFHAASYPGRVTVQPELPISRVDSSIPIICHSFHKTGTEVCGNFLKSRQLVTAEPYKVCWLENCSSVSSDGQLANTNFLFGEDALGRLGDAPYRMLNWIREPHQVILSAFRFHMQTPEEWEWLNNRCYSCGEEDWDVMYSLTSEPCNYFQLLSSVAAANETAGVIVEALNERRNIELMFNTTFAYVNDPRVLHLSTEHLKKNFTQTMACINTFMDGKGLKPEELQAFESFNPDRPDFQKDAHVTTGKYDNGALREFLLSQPVWGPEFVAASEYIGKIFQREAVAFGCPAL